MKAHGVLYRIVAFVSLSMLVVPSVLADDKPVRIARYAVTRLIKDRVGRDSRVVFEKDNDGFLSFSERKITGAGYVRYDGKTRDFKYSVKVKPSSEEYRDVDVDFTNDRYREDDRWNRPDWDRQREWDRDRDRYDDRDRFVRFKSPYNSQKIGDDEVRFRGEASNGKVRLRVYDWDGRTVLDRDLGVVRGEWWTSTRLSRGTYKAVAELSNSRRQDERVFSVRDRDEERGYLRIDSAGRESYRDGVVRLSGTSSADYVRVRVYDDRDRQVSDKEVRVSRDRWSVEIRVDRSGRYRAKAENVRSRGDSEVRFTVNNGRDHDRDWDRDRDRRDREWPR